MMNEKQSVRYKDGSCGSSHEIGMYNNNLLWPRP